MSDFPHNDHPLRHYDKTCAACEIERLRTELALEKQCYADVQAECDHWFKAHEEEQIEHDKTRAERDAIDVEKDAWQGRYYAAAGELDALKKELNESRKNDLTNHHYLHAIRDALDCNEMNYPTLVEYCKKLDKKLNPMEESK